LTERRIAKLQVVYRRRERGALDGIRLDFSALTPDDIAELDALLDEPAAHQRRYGKPSYGMLTAAQRARLDALLARVTEAR
jgi:hypothetical protein